MISQEWKDIASLIGPLIAVGGLLFAWLKLRLAGDFAPAADIAAVREEVEKARARLAQVEARLTGMPSHDDIARLSARVGEVERGVAVVGEAVRGTGEVVKRVERMVDLLVRHQLQGEKAGG
ncbi:hypothetical protein GCM10010964_18510 [Caldovatus sediminis]|uniref:DUF2730 family protein n=1 Tax=Caldovatus sediminis TaxID=2041189 RepID=A0A8J3EAV0_9PROT|nr:DUF2730 family protein [Caldovatus sediminis]GGG30882.1 hypothetical protein GCM10010964_18510 [Caldovatus sediminis]